MGSCFSKHEELAPPASQTATTKRTKPVQGTKPGQVLGGQLEQTLSRTAAAQAAEQRYTAQQEKLKASQAKLKAMEKVSKKDKGLA